MKKSFKELLVILYELSIQFGIPIFLLFVILKDSISSCLVIGILLYSLPALIHGGAFGNKAKEMIDKIMGYEF